MICSSEAITTKNSYGYGLFALPCILAGQTNIGILNSKSWLADYTGLTSDLQN
jgi:hypothetical protein